MSGAVCLGQHNYAYYICRSRNSLVPRYRCGMLMRVITGRPTRLSLSRRRDFLTSNITLWFQIIRCTRMMEYSSTRLLYSTKSIRPQQILIYESIVFTGEMILTPTPATTPPHSEPSAGHMETDNLLPVPLFQAHTTKVAFMKPSIDIQKPSPKFIIHCWYSQMVANETLQMTLKFTDNLKTIHFYR